MDKEAKEYSLILLENGKVYSPKHLGKRNILIGGKTILSIRDKQFSSLVSELPTKEIDIEGMFVIPGLIDLHIHLTGGGGEGGPESRAPEAKIPELLEAGITTAIGTLGTDSITRSLENLLAKTKALNNLSLSAYMYTGAYSVPSPTLTGSIMRDLVLIQEVIGVKIALSDHRSSYPTIGELKKIAHESRVGGMLGGKAGIVHIHMGKEPDMLNKLWRIVEETDIPIGQFLPTHMSRTPNLIEEAVKWIKAGGVCDFTAGARTPELIQSFKEENVPLEQITISTDAYGSAPVFNEDGSLASIGVARPHSLLKVLSDCYSYYNFAIDECIPLCTSNVARILKLKNKGQIATGYDADLVIIDDDFNIQYVISKGQIMKTPEWTFKGYYQDE